MTLLAAVFHSSITTRDCLPGNRTLFATAASGAWSKWIMPVAPMYILSQETYHLWLAIILICTVRLWWFLHRRYRESRQSKCRPTYFPTSPKLCFCTTWGNRTPKKCIFSLKCCMLFTKKHETH